MSCDVSVIIPVYNSSGTLRRALDSIYNQSMLPQEIIIVDDGSDDWEESKIISASYSENIYVRFIRLKKNMGVSVARNVGLKVSSCRYISFLDSDEVWFKDKVGIQYEIMVHNKIDFSMHGLIEPPMYSWSNTGAKNDVKPLWIPLSSWSLLFKNRGTSTVMVLREKMVPFDSSLRRIEDWKCWMEVLSQNGIKSAYIRRTLAERLKPGLGSSGLSQNVKAMHVSRMVALKRLMDEGTITIVQYLIGICMETTIYPLRVVIIALRRY
jgi:glycosyltransferase involved in cell wall biosynthesis